MSKRELKAKQILVAILCAASMQVWSAPPVWSAQSVGDAAVSGQIDKKAKTADAANKDAEESEEKAAAEAETAAGENSVPTIGSYSISPRLAGASTYADGTVGNITVTGGAMTGVVSINGVAIETDSSLESLIIGTGVFNNMYEITQSTAFGNKVNVIDAHASVFGYNAKGWGPAVTVMGWMAAASGDNAVAIGAESVVSAGHNNSVAIGAKSSTSAANQVAFGDLSNPFVTTSYRSLAGIKDISLLGKINDVSIGNGGINGAAINADGNNLSIGVSASVANSGGGGTAFGNSTVITNANSSIFGALAQAQADNTTAIGYSAYANGDKSTALGANASSLGQGSMALGSGATVAAEHRKSIAIGYGSKTSDSNQVAFGDMANPSSFRSLGGITNIHMTGTIYADGIANLSRINDAFYSVARGSYSLVLGNLTDDGVLSGATIFGVTGNVMGTGVSVFGGQANVRGNNSSAFGNEASVGGDNSSVFGAGAGTIMNSTNNSAFGTQAIVASSNSSSFGYKALVENNADGSLALGASSTVKSGHTGSVAIGSGSKTSAANQVVFGDMTTPTSFRSLAGIKDIALTGAITGATSINGIGIDSSRNLTNVGTINGVDLANLGSGSADFTNIQSNIVVKKADNTETFKVDQNTGNVTAGTFNDLELYGNTSDIAIGVSAQVTGGDSIAIGYQANAVAGEAVAIGSSSTAESESIAVGKGSTAGAYDSVALGYGATVASGHTDSVAIGSGSKTSAANQVVFGDMTAVNDTSSYRSLAGIKDISLTGAITGATSINGIGIDSSRNLTNVGTINGIDLANLGSGGADFTNIQSNIVVKKVDNTETFKVDQNTGDVTAGTFNYLNLYGNGSDIAIGADAKVIGGDAVAIGYQANANGEAIAIGSSSTAESESIAVGKGSTVEALRSVALGKETTVASGHTGSVAIGFGSKTSAANQVAFGDMTAVNDTSSYRSLAGIKDISLTGAINGVTITSGALTGVTTINGKDINNLSGADFTDIQSDIVVKDTGNTTTFNVDRSTGNVTTSGTVTATEFVEGSTKLSDKYAGKSDFNTLNNTVTAANTGLVDRTAALETDKADKTYVDGNFAKSTDVYTKTEVNTQLGNKVDTSTYNSKVSDLERADAALQTKTTNLSTDGTTLTGMTDITSTSATLGDVTFAANGVVTGVNSLNGIGIAVSGTTAKTLTVDGTLDATTLRQGGKSIYTAEEIDAKFGTSSGDVSALTGRVTTAEGKINTLEGNTDGISVDGGMTKLANGFKVGATSYGMDNTGNLTASSISEGGQALSAKYAGKNEAYTDAKAALKADKNYVDVNFADVNTQLGNKANADASGLTDPNKTAWKNALGVDTLETTVAGKADTTIVTALETTLTDISYNNLTRTTTVGGVTLQNGQLGSVTKLNNAIIGTDAKGITIDGVGLKSIAGRVDALEQSGGGGGGSSQNTAGIKRTDTDGDTVDDTTTIENATSFTTDGMKTSNLQAATAAIGGVNFGGNGALTNVASINGISFDGGKVGGVSLSGGKVDGVSISGLNNRVSALENSGGSGGGGGGSTGGGANTEGITRPDNSHTTIEGNTTIGADGVDTNDLTASGSITVAKGETNQTVIDKDGIHVGKNSSVVNDTDGFITDKGLYIGVESSSNLGSAKFSVAPNGNLSSTAGNFGFSNTSTDGAKFTDTGSIAHGGGSVMDTTIKGNTVTTGRVDTDELYVGGNKVVISGSTVQPGTHIDNHLEGTDASGNKFINDFTTSALNGTTQSAEKESADGKNTIKTTNNTSATGTSNTTAKTDVDGSDNTTVQKSELTTNENGMKLNTSNTVTDKNGTVTSSSSGETNMTGDSLTVSKTTTTKDADGNDVTKTSSTTVGSGEVTLNREDGSSIRVGDAIEGLQSDVQELGGRINEMGVEIKEVGALSAALAGLHPQPQNANTKADFAMAMGSYEGKQALAVGAFYRPDKRVMLSMGASTTSSKHMMNMGISIALDRMPEAERKAQEAGTADNETLNKVLERLEKLELENQKLSAENKKRDADYEKLAGDYAELKEKYAEEKTAE